MHRCTLLAVLAGCRLQFAERPTDAPPDMSADASPLALACNTPVMIAAVPSAPQLSTAVVGTRVIATWVEATGTLGSAFVDFVAPDRVFTRTVQLPGDTGYGQVAAAAAAGVVVAAYTQNGTSYVELVDRDENNIAGPTATPLAVLGPGAVVATGNASGVIAAIAGNDAMTNRAEVLPVLLDGTLGTPVDIGAIDSTSSLVAVGDRLAMVRSTTTSNCVVSTLDPDVTGHGANAGWGTANQCTQASLAYSPGRTDALLVRHDMTDGDLNHVITTRNGTGYTTPGESRLRNPGNDPRPIGVIDGYWVSYETGGTIEAAHVDVAGTIGKVVVLGPLAMSTAHATFVTGGEPYAIWVQDGLELAHLCP